MPAAAPFDLPSQINPEIPQQATGVDTSSLVLSSEGYEGLGSLFQEQPFLVPAGEMGPNEPETLSSADRRLPGDSSPASSHCRLYSSESVEHLLHHLGLGVIRTLVCMPDNHQQSLLNSCFGLHAQTC